MARGRRAPKRGRVGRAPARAMARGGRTRPRPAPRGRGRKMPGGGSTCGGMNQPPCPGGGGGYRRGGRTRPSPRGRPVANRHTRGRAMARGGRAGVRRMQGGGGASNNGCTMWTGKYDCESKPNCNWNFDDNSCN